MPRHSRRLSVRTSIIALAAAIGVAATGLTASGASAAPESMTCTPAHLISVPGTFETNAAADPNKPAGMLAAAVNQVTAQLGNSVVSTFTANYEAQAFTAGVAYADSKKQGIGVVENHLRAYTSACPNSKIAIVGYSQGADIVGDTITHITSGQLPIPKNQIAVAILLADPGRGTAGEIRVGPNTPGNGIAGPRNGTFAGIPTYTICGPNDLYCSVGKNSPFTTSVGKALTHLGANNSTDATPPSTPTATTATAPTVPTSGTSSSDPSQLLNAADRNLAAATVNSPVSQFNQGVQQIQSAAQKGDATTVSATAQNLQSQIPALTNLQNTVNQSTIVPTLSSFDQGTQQRAAGDSLGEVKNVDIQNVSKILDTLANVSGGINADQMVQSGASLASSLSAFAGSNAGDVSSAASMVSSIQPTAILRNAAQSADAFSRVDVMGMVNNLQAIGTAVVQGNFPALPDQINSLDDKIVGLSAAVKTVDLTPLSTVLMMFPINTPTYWVGVGVRIFSQLDLVGISSDLRDIIKNGMNMDLLAIPPLVLDLASKAVSLTSSTISLTGVSGDANISQVASALTNFDPKTLSSEITKATAFFGTQAAPHVNDYKDIPIDGAPNALAWIVDCIVKALRQAV